MPNAESTTVPRVIISIPVKIMLKADEKTSSLLYYLSIANRKTSS